MSKKGETPLSPLLSNIMKCGYPHHSQLCLYFANLIFPIQSNYFENWLKFIGTLNEAIHCLPMT